MFDKSTTVWTSRFTFQIIEALRGCSSMDDPLVRNTFVRALKSNLGTSNFHIPSHSDAGMHIYLIVQACRDYKSPTDALRALYLTALDLLPNTRATEVLQVRERQINASGAMSPDRLRSVLDLVSRLHSHPGPLKLLELANGIKYEDEILPTDSLNPQASLAEIVARLNDARVTGHGPIPPVVRYIVALIPHLHGEDELLMMAELDGLAEDLGISATGVIADTYSLLSRPEIRILQITVTVEGSTSQRSYIIDGKLLNVISGVRRNPTPLTPSRDPDIDNAWAQFIRNASDLGNQLGGDPPVTIEFILPSPLLGFPVEHWNIDIDNEDGGYPIGCLFPVIVRSQERQEYGIYLGQWRHRWSMLYGSDSRRPLRDRMAWLHDEGFDLTRGVERERRIKMHEQGCLTSWLAENKDLNTVSLGLTYAYRPDDAIAKLSLREAFQEGIPILIWRRDGGNPDELVALMTITIHQLKDNMLTWRKAARVDSKKADGKKVGAHIVVMWDDPTDLSLALSRPQKAMEGS